MTAPYVERYFEVLPDTPRVRSGWSLNVAAEAFYPLPHADRRTLDLATRLVDDADALPGDVRQRLTNLADETARRIRIREAYPHD